MRAGSFFPSLLERRRPIDQALFAVVMEAYLHGVSTRKVNDLVRALGADTASPSPRCPDQHRRGRGSQRVSGPLAGRSVLSLRFLGAVTSPGLLKRPSSRGLVRCWACRYANVLAGRVPRPAILACGWARDTHMCR
jgi:hypothetical protein